MTATTTTEMMTTGPSRTPLLAALGIGASAVLTAVGTFWSPLNDADAEHSIGEYLVVVGMAAVCAAIVFGLVVRTADRGNAGRRAVILGVVGFLSLAAFWAGFPAVIATGGLACALAQRGRAGTFSAGSKAGLALSSLTLAAAVWLAIAG